jgi:hypothetical protein
MSLVIAKIIENKIYIESDSRVTDLSIVKNDPLCGVIKALVLNPFLTIAFAGDIMYAEKALERINKNPNFNLDFVLQLLNHIHLESNEKTDFIIASYINNTSRLFKISSRKVETDISTCWIGDNLAFSLFQENRLKNIKKGQSELDALRSGFKEVVNSEVIQTVGDYQISIMVSKIGAPSPRYIVPSIG